MGDTRCVADPTDHVELIVLHGDLGMIDRKWLEARLPKPRVDLRLVINCVDVNSMDSTIIALLMMYRQRLQIAGGDPANIVFMVNARLERLFDLTGVSRTMTVLPAAQ